jgi:CBS domain containing-hemolysin-like protein
MAVVVDEYGATAGLVTLNDVIEEIIGVVSDEFEKAESDIEIISDNEIIVNAGMHVEILLEQFSVEVETDGFDTIGGLLYSKLGKMANPNDEVIYKKLKLTILSTAGRRIKRVKVTKKS